MSRRDFLGALLTGLEAVGLTRLWRRPPPAVSLPPLPFPCNDPAFTEGAHHEWETGYIPGGHRGSILLRGIRASTLKGVDMTIRRMIGPVRDMLALETSLDGTTTQQFSFAADPGSPPLPMLMAQCCMLSIGLCTKTVFRTGPDDETGDLMVFEDVVLSGRRLIPAVRADGF